MGLWVDTDFGFDDLWALLLLRAEGALPDGVSLVAGNAVMAQVRRNAAGACAAFGLSAPLFQGADRPLQRPLETARRILGPEGMMTRGVRLPQTESPPLPPAHTALQSWLGDGQARHDVLALGPLTNLARLARAAPGAFAGITRLVWMGGASARGNHTGAAEFNALVDAQALAEVAGTGVPLEIVDLEACRTVTFGPEHMPALPQPLADLLGGYLDIALSRGRPAMAIYDPLAALAMLDPAAVTFTPQRLTVTTTDTRDHGRTRFVPDPESPVSLATGIVPGAAARCLAALTQAAS